MASFTDALEENPAPRRLGDIRLRYEPGRLLGESLAPSFWRRQLPSLCVVLAALCALGAVVGVLLGGGDERTPPAPAALGVLAVALMGFALRLEGQLGRRRFVLHFPTERLRLERLRWAPGATRVQWVPFDEVSAVEVVERAPGRYALVVVWRPGGMEGEHWREVLVEHIGASEQEALFRVWRLLHNAFGLRGAGLAGG
ncbi:hypothetical protein JQX13_49730 [Archangium violaceum]|uniref:hypothetical protein n=1 Tax=Archangium violaceum TaxID=83451 RepID=UPI00193B9878|nr:hypothetical protein [Archangium violaceum]QRK07956.1 hypothetical protein JQX13_49730 [Archangium violaceum]